MTFLMVLVATIVAVLALRQPLHKWPVAFYALAVVADVAYIAGIEGLLPRAVTSPLTLLMGKCQRQQNTCLLSFMLYLSTAPTSSEISFTPNVTSIAEIARAAEAGGADAVSLIKDRKSVV